MGMLVGTLVYRDKDYGEFTYRLKGVEVGEFRLSVENTYEDSSLRQAKAQNLLDRYYNEDGTENIEYSRVSSHYRRIDVRNSNSARTNIVNGEMVSRVAGLIRYGLMQDNVKSEEESLFETLAEGSSNTYFDAVIKLEKEVVIPNMGEIHYYKGKITKLKLSSIYADIDLTYIESTEMLQGQFRPLKQKDDWGNLLSTTPVVNISFKLNKDTIGFDYKPPVVEMPVNVFDVYSTLEEVERAHPDKNIKWIKGRKYVVVTDDILEEVVEEFKNYNGYIAFDTETTGLKITFRSRLGKDDQLVGVVLSKEIGTGYYFPLQHKCFPNVCGGDHFYFMRTYMKDILETKKIVTHNISFDWKVAYIYNIVVNVVFDTMIALQCTERYRDKNFEVGLKSITKLLYQLDMLDIDDFLTNGKTLKTSKATFADLPYDLVQAYAPTDGDATLMLMHWIVKERLLERYKAERIFEEEITFGAAAAYSQFWGYHIEQSEIPALTEEILKEKAKREANIYNIVGYEFNIGSPSQLAKALYDDLKMPNDKEKKKTDKDTLTEYMNYYDENGDAKYPIVFEIKAWRDADSIHKNFLKKLHIFLNDDGIIHPKIFPFGTDTGRASIKEPNYQSYNDEVKKRVTGRSGYYMFDCDFSQIEYRVLASMAGQQSLIDAFDDPDLDYHTYQASRMFNVPYASVPKKLRSQSKGINFGLPYGMGDASLGARIFGERNQTNTLKARELRTKFFEGQELILEFFERTRDDGVKNKFTRTYFGRSRFYNPATTNEGGIRRQAGNHVIQGTAADIYKMAVNRMFLRVIKEGWLDLVLFNAFVHDELLMEVHQSIDPYYFFKAWREEFQLEIDGFCKLYAGAGVGYSWYEAKKQDLSVQFIQEIIDVHDSGTVDWNEDYHSFINWTNEAFTQHKVKRVADFIVDKNNHMQVVTPTINSLMYEAVIDHINSFTLMPKDDGSLSEISFQTGVFLEYGKKYKEKDLQGMNFYDIKKLFQYFLNIQTDVEILSPDDADKAISKADDGKPRVVPKHYVSLDTTNYDIADYAMYKGYHIDDNDMKVYLTDMQVNSNGQMISLFQYFVNNQWIENENSTGGYKVCSVNIETKEVLEYNAYVSHSSLAKVMNTYATLKQYAVTRW